MCRRLVLLEWDWRVILFFRILGVNILLMKLIMRKGHANCEFRICDFF